MPVEQGSTTKDGKRVGFFRWGKSGKKYYYRPKNEKSRTRAKRLAAMQGRAIKFSQSQRGG